MNCKKFEFEYMNGRIKNCIFIVICYLFNAYFIKGSVANCKINKYLGIPKVYLKNVIAAYA